jgi:hypothetical protein
MRRAVLVLILAAFVTAANSQSGCDRITILPQAGLENPTTKISYNNLSYFSPLNQLQPQLGVVANYKFRNGFGPFVGLSTSRSVVSYNFSDPENGMSNYRASMGKVQLQLRAGVQYTSRPILISQRSSGNSVKTESSEKTSSCYEHYSSCSHYSSSCCTRKSSLAQRTKSQNQSWSLRIQSSAGFAFVPTNTADLVTKTSAGQPQYEYNAGNFKTAMITGVGFEFARNRSRLFTLTVSYFKGLGNNETTFTSQSGTKTTTTTLNSKVSGWNASIGIPFSVTKKPSFSHKTRSEQSIKYDCQQYRSEHKYKCGRII